MEWESESSLYHTWFRQYDPSQGRWMSVDPLAGTTDNPQSQDRYVYVLDDPVNLTDPLGLFMARPPHCERDGMEVLGIFCDPDRPGGRPSPGGEGPGRGPEDETGGGGGNPPKEKAKKIVKFALSQEKLDDCIRQIFEGKATLTAKNRPFILRTDLSFLGEGTVGAPVAVVGRGIVGIDTRAFDNTQSSIKYLSAVYLHEAGNILARKLFGNSFARPATPDVQELFGGDLDTGANLENCAFGGQVLPSGDVLLPNR